ncbi:MAG: transporter suffix domain-containing protein [Pseudomonadales bacterium]|nr:transporter suffix domain-containing protein [Pseudomonadales bacterium]
MLDRYPLLRELTIRQWLGWVLITLSCLAWLALPVVPFLPMELTDKGVWTGGLIVFAEIAWWCAMPLLGPEIAAVIRNSWAAIKGWFKSKFSRSSD